MRQRTIAAVVVGVVLLSVVIGAAATLSAGRNPVGGQGGGGTVAVIPVSGMIVSGRGVPGLFGGSQAGSDEITARLRQAARDPGVKAVVLRLNSPGGTAAGAQEIAAAVDRVRKAGKKVVASMGDTAASGAYWVACRADKIVAEPGTLTGSIGVIMQTQDLQGLYHKLGIATETFKSGPYKDMGAPNRPVTPAERDIFQGMVNDIYDQFVHTVADGRKMNPDRVKQLATGRVYTGRQALQLGLVDQLGSFQDALDLAGRLSGLGPEPRVTDLGPRGFWQDIMGGAGSLAGLAAPATAGRAFYPAVWLLVPAGPLPEGVLSTAGTQ
ncbi:signal peptide peptidase SppA [Desulfotomaculum copahuensis]|uniref:Clp protease ClpP n=1 Tax=Desulfotomaculum copahuensis TaxID=1838280 RepID=A0A1B7LB44_9FIRM|nr:signal peptide peptidase SppA [Desulfotomaculum copahuensis]OAT79752.1 Clp protease ClpP [Desulfotomaculum copahuensis]